MSQPAASENPQENLLPKKCAAPVATVETENGSVDSDLHASIERWSELPEAMRAGISLMLKSYKG